MKFIKVIVCVFIVGFTCLVWLSSSAKAASPISIDAQVSTHLTSNATSITSPSFSTTQPNELVLAYLGSDGPNSAGSQTFSGVTGASLTWTLRQRADAQAGDAEIWQAVAPTTLKSVTVKATMSRGGYQGFMDIVSFVGANTTANGATATQSATSGAPTLKLTTTAANSWVWAVGDDWDNGVARTIGSGQTMFDQYVDKNSGDTYWTQYQTAQSYASGTALTSNDTAPTTDRWNMAAIEILPATTTTTTPPTVPTNLSATAPTSALVNLTWTASTDPVGVSGYSVYRNGTLIGTSPTNSYADGTVAANTPYSYTVSATGTDGNVSAQSTPATVTTPPLPTKSPPIVSITSQPPAQTNATTATVAFSATNTTDPSGSIGFTCSLDTAAYSPCSSPATYTGLASGAHTVGVIATDSSDGLSSTAAVASWTIALASPIVSITARPAVATNSTTATVAFSATNPTDPTGPISFTCSLDAAAYSPCASPAVYTALAAGTHTVQVIATDSFDGLSSTAALVSWTIDLTPPTVSITSPVASATVSGTVVVTAGVSDSAGIASVQFAVDGVNVSTPVTTSPYTYSWNTTAVSNGTHTLTALATDSVGNTATSGGVTVTVSNTSSSSPITIDAHVSTHGSTATTISSPSFSTLAANELLVAYVGSDGPNGAKSQTFSSVTGGGLTWTMRERADGQPGDAEIWQAVAPTPLTGITVTATRSAGAYQGSLSVVSYIGASTTINGSVSTQSGASGAPSVSLTTTANNSWVWGVGNDWDNAVARTIGPNQTMFDQFVDTGTGDTFWTQYQTGQNLASGTAVTINDTTPTGDSWNLAAIEIVPSGGSTPPPPPPPPVLPSVPTNLSATAVNGSLVDLSWTASTDVNGVDGYDVYRNGSLLGVTTATTYADATVTAGTTYSYTVAAYDALGNTSAQSTAAIVTPPVSGTTIFSDNFSGTALDSAWTIIDRHGEYAQSETECNVPGAVAVANNILSITTTAQSATCGDFNLDGSVRHAPTTWPYTTGDVQWTNFSFLYGTVTYQAKFPAASTKTWPAVWFLGSNCQATNIETADTNYSTCPQIEKPGSGYEEIDATECYQTEWCQLALAQPSSFPVCVYPVDTNWHTYTMVWTPTSISITMDGKSTGCSYSSANGYVIPNTPMFMIIQTQTGGSGGTPNNAQLPAVLQIADVTVTQP